MNVPIQFERIGSRLIDSPAYQVIWPVKDGVGVAHYVRAEDSRKGRVGLAGPSLCGRMPESGAPLRWRHLSKAPDRVCNACHAAACGEPTRVKLRDLFVGRRKRN